MGSGVRCPMGRAVFEGLLFAQPRLPAAASQATAPAIITGSSPDFDLTVTYEDTSSASTSFHLCVQ